MWPHVEKQPQLYLERLNRAPFILSLQQLSRPAEQQMSSAADIHSTQAKRAANASIAQADLELKRFFDLLTTVSPAGSLHAAVNEEDLEENGSGAIDADSSLSCGELPCKIAAADDSSSTAFNTDQNPPGKAVFSDDRPSMPSEQAINITDFAAVNAELSNGTKCNFDDSGYLLELANSAKRAAVQLLPSTSRLALHSASITEKALTKLLEEGGSDPALAAELRNMADVAEKAASTTEELPLMQQITGLQCTK